MISYMRMSPNSSQLNDEIRVPRDVRDSPPEMAEKTVLGYSRGAKRQYRHGRLHIREYDDGFVVHTDKFDPRSDPLLHLVYDAPEVLVGIGCAVLEYAISSARGRGPAASVASGILSGYAGYAATKRLKEPDHVTADD